MRARPLAALTLALALLAIGAAGAAAQNLRFSVVPAAVTGTLAPDSDVILNQTLSVRGRKITSWFVTFSQGLYGTFADRRARGAGGYLSYQVYDNAVSRNVLKDLSANPSASEVLAGTFTYATGWQTQNGPFTVVVPSGQLPAPGAYTDTINLELYAGTPASPGAQQDTASFAVSITVTASLDVSLVATGAPFNIGSISATFDFGALVAGASRGGDILVRSNGPYSITVTSLGGGVLKPADLSDPSSVPYAVIANGLPVPLAPGIAEPVATGAAATTYAGARYSLSVGIGSYGWATEGAYSDVLTFQATAN